MPFRVGQESGRRGWYVFVDRPKELRGRRGGKTVRRKAGETREEALKNALRIEATLMASWVAELNKSPFQAARKASNEQGVPLDEALDHELRERGYKQKEKDRLVLGLFDREKVEAQGLELCLSREEKAQLEKGRPELSRRWLNYEETQWCISCVLHVD